VHLPTLTLAAALLFAGSIFGQDTPTPHQDYSRDALLRFVASNDIKMSPLPEHLKGGRIQWHLGWMEFRGLGMEWRIVYLPIVIPLAGSTLHDIAKVPNALELTGTPIAAGPQLFPDRTAAVNRELKRVLKIERQAKIKVEP
jgi:hypothetical protein